MLAHRISSANPIGFLTMRPATTSNRKSASGMASGSYRSPLGRSGPGSRLSHSRAHLLPVSLPLPPVLRDCRQKASGLSYTTRRTVASGVPPAAQLLDELGHGQRVGLAPVAGRVDQSPAPAPYRSTMSAARAGVHLVVGYRVMTHPEAGVQSRA